MGIGTGAQRVVERRARERPELAGGGVLRHRLGAVKAELRAKLLLPILGDQYGRVLERGELQLGFHDGAAGADATSTTSCRSIRARRRASSRRALEPLTGELGADNPRCTSSRASSRSLQNLPPYTEQRPGADGGAAAREGSGAHASGAAGRRDAGGRRADRAARRAASTATPGRPESFDRAARAARGAGLPALVLADGVARDQLPALLRRQHARRPAGRAARSLRRDAPAARAAARATARVHGVRIDHPGRPVRSGALLRDAAGPGRARLGHRAADRRRPQRRARSTSSPRRSCRAGSALPSRWAVHGTTGYNFSTISTASSSTRRARAAHAPDLREAHRPDSNRSTTCVYESKRLIMETRWRAS